MADCRSIHQQLSGEAIKRNLAQESEVRRLKAALAEAIAIERAECAAIAFRHSKAHEQASQKATTDADRDLAVNMSLAADGVGQAILARSS